MAKANVNIEDVVVFRKSVEMETYNLNRINKHLSNEIGEIIYSLEAEIKKFDTVIENCSKGITIASDKIHEEKVMLEEYCARLATTPKTITVIVRDNSGGYREIESPNPEYIALVEMISEIERKISRIENIIEEFQKLKCEAYDKRQIIIDVKIKIEEIEEELKGYFLRINMYSEEAIKRLTEIEEVLHEYIATQIRRNF